LKLFLLFGPLMHWLCATELPAIRFLQQLFIFRCDSCHYFWYFVTKLGNPSIAMTVFFPLIYPFDPQRAIKLIYGVCFGECVVNIIKWLVFGDRPYWFAMMHDIPLMQFSPTCETGPGNPRAHVMSTAIILYTIMSLFSNMRSRTATTTYYIVLIFMALSRVAIAAHFVHQVVLGLILGTFLGRKLSAMQPTTWRHETICMTALLLGASAAFVYMTFAAFGIDVNWSIAIATVNCRHARWVNISTTPLASWIRDISVFLAIAFCIKSQIEFKLPDGQMSTSSKLATGLINAALMSTLGYLVDIVGRSAASASLYYVLFAGANFIFCYFVVARTIGNVAASWQQRLSRSSTAVLDVYPPTACMTPNWHHHLT